MNKYSRFCYLFYSWVYATLEKKQEKPRFVIARIIPASLKKKKQVPSAYPDETQVMTPVTGHILIKIPEIKKTDHRNQHTSSKLPFLLITATSDAWRGVTLCFTDTALFLTAFIFSGNSNLIE